MLELVEIHAGYGNNDVLHGLSMTVPASSISVLLGANGAGKTTIMRAAIGDLAGGGGGKVRGQIRFAERDVTSRSVADHVAAGMALVPEGGRVFTEFTVDRNLSLGAFLTRDRGAVERRREEVFTLFPVLAERREQRAGTLSGGERQMLAIGRALMSAPRLLLLDEPFLGLAPVVIDQVVDSLRRIRETNDVTILVAEQNTRVLDVADLAFGLRLGEIVLRDEQPSRLASGDGARRLETAFFGSVTEPATARTDR